ncbi:hypothetical protein [Paraburkholderia tropica]|uniref:hypothetical protein n=1 Tax=Paraburkholderia tropica TaxID=92647 RepID=UPI002AB69FBC|nr:hypothetical protein [Paraburkholderia tropica]
MNLPYILRSSQPGTFRFVWDIPILLAALTVFGLLAALLGTGFWHGLAWLALAIPILVGVRFSLWPVSGTRASTDQKRSARRP